MSTIDSRINNPTAVVTSGGIPVTSDLPGYDEFVANAINGLVKSAGWEVYGDSVSSLADIYGHRVASLHIEPYTSDLKTKVGIPSEAYNPNGFTYHNNSLNQIKNKPGAETVYIDVESRKTTLAPIGVQVAQSLMHEILHDAPLLDAAARNAAQLTISLVDSGKAGYGLAGELNLRTLSDLIEHAFIGILVDRASKETFEFAYAKRPMLTGATRFYIDTGIAIGVLGGKDMASLSAAQRTTLIGLGYEPSFEPSDLGSFETDGVMLILPVAAKTGGAITHYINEQGDLVDVVGAGSFAQLSNYATEKVRPDGSVYSSYSFGAGLRILGDLLGLDGELGVQGSFRKPWEGSKGVPSPVGGLAGNRSVSSNAHEQGHQSISSGNSQSLSQGSSSHDHDHDAGSKGGAFQGLKDALNPILLDLDGDGVEITGLDKSTRFVVDENGLKHRTAWAGNGDGVLFIDADGNGEISNAHEYVFTEWDASADDDMEALRTAFDKNGDGKLTAADTLAGGLDWDDFKVLVTKPNGDTEVKTLSQLGITEIGLEADTTRIVLPDGSTITGQAGFVIGGVTRTAANVVLMAEAMGATVTDSVTGGGGTRTVVSTGTGEGGERLFVVQSVTVQAQGLVTNSWDMDGDGVFERVQKIVTVVNGDGSRTETEENWQGSSTATGVKDSRTVTTTSADGKQVTIERDPSWAGWFAERETQTTNGSGTRNVLIEALAPDGSVITVTKAGLSADGLTRTFYENIDGIGGSGSSGAERITTTTITEDGAGVRTETVVVTNNNGSAVGSDTATISADGRDRTTLSDVTGDGVFDVKLVEETDQVAGGGTSTQIWVRNGNDALRSKTTATVSADGLTTVRTEDFDGSTTTDRTTTETVAIDGAGTRTTTVTATNANGSVYGKTKTVLGADKVTREEWVDLNQDGTFQTTDKVLGVTVEAGTQDRLSTSWLRNPDGSVVSVSTERTSLDGLSRTSTIDFENDADLDRHETDVTTVSGGASTRTVTLKTGNQADVIAKTETTVSAVNRPGFTGEFWV